MCTLYVGRNTFPTIPPENANERSKWMQKQHDLSGESAEWKCIPFLPFFLPSLSVAARDIPCFPDRRVEITRIVLSIRLRLFLPDVKYIWVCDCAKRKLTNNLSKKLDPWCRSMTSCCKIRFAMYVNYTGILGYFRIIAVFSKCESDERNTKI